MDWLSEACLLIDKGHARSGVDLLPKLSGQQAFSRYMGKERVLSSAPYRSELQERPLGLVWVLTATDPVPRVTGGGLIVSQCDFIPLLLSHLLGPS